MRLSLPRVVLVLSLLCGAAPAFAGSVTLWSVPGPAATGKQGFIRVTNPSTVEASVQMYAIDDAGKVTGPATFKLPPGQSRQFNSQDMKDGSSAKGLTGGFGTPTGEWQIELYSNEPITAAGFVRTPDGFLANMSDTVDTGDGLIAVVPMFNPANNPNQVSELRLVNPNPNPMAVEITGVDDAGEPGDATVKVTLAASGAVTLTAANLETGTHAKITAGKLGTGTGKWRLKVKAPAPIRVMSLIRDPMGYVNNVSTVAEELESAIPTCANLNGAAIFSQEAKPVYLGFIGGTGGDSINNTGGDYGSATGTLSVRNPNGAYGSATGEFSAMNPHSATPPVVIKDGRILAALTNNVYYTKYRRLSLNALGLSCQPTATARGAF